MKVLIAHNRYRNPGGEERHIELLAGCLEAAGHQIRRFEPSSDALAGSRPKRIGVGATLAYRPGGAGIESALTDWRPDVVHFHNLWPQLTPSAARLAKRAGAATVLTLHNCRFACPAGACPLAVKGRRPRHGIQGMPSSSLRCAVERNPRGDLAESLAYGLAQEIQRRRGMLTRWIDGFIAPSLYVRRMLASTGVPDARITVIPHGVPARSATAASGSDFALYAGRLTNDKGVRTLAEAAGAVPEVPVLVAGSGPLSEFVRGAPLRYVGQLDRQAVDAALSAAAFMVIPSECQETLSYSALESFSAGKPVIATTVGGLPEIVIHEVTGLLVPPASPSALGAAMAKLWRDPGLTRRLGSNALEVARETYSLDRQIQRTVELFSRLCARRPSDAAPPVNA